MDKLEQLRADHERIRLDIDRLRILAAAPTGVVSDQRFRELIGRDVLAFGEDLRQHFRLEEEGGYFTDVLDRRPNAEARIARLYEQHGMILERVAEVLNAVERAADIEEVCRVVSELIDIVAEHERSETSLLQESWLQDTGTCD